jgi:hypothetical protein
MRRAARRKVSEEMQEDFAEKLRAKITTEDLQAEAQRMPSEELLAATNTRGLGK